MSEDAKKEKEEAVIVWQLNR